VVAAAGAAWPTIPTVDSTPVTTATIVEEQPATDHANAVQISNGSILTGNWSMVSYLVLILSCVLAVMSALWLLPRRRARAKTEVADEEGTCCVPLHVQLGARCAHHRFVRSGMKPNISSVGPISLSPTTST
jgi:hypothetical protein